MTVDATKVKELRERTGAGIMDCKQALSQVQGDLDQAISLLRQKGLAKAAKKAGRETKEGMVGTYVHPGGKIGVMVEVACETDFVARNPEFQELVKDLTLHIAAADPSPRFVQREEIPEEVLKDERQMYEEQAKSLGKPQKVLDQIVQGKLEKFFGEVCLLEQPFIKDPEMKMGEMITQKVAKIGENIRIRRFVRYKLGE